MPKNLYWKSFEKGIYSLVGVQPDRAEEVYAIIETDEALDNPANGHHRGLVMGGVSYGLVGAAARGQSLSHRSTKIGFADVLEGYKAECHQQVVTAFTQATSA